MQSATLTCLPGANTRCKLEVCINGCKETDSVSFPGRKSIVEQKSFFFYSRYAHVWVLHLLKYLHFSSWRSQAGIR